MYFEGILKSIDNDTVEITRFGNSTLIIADKIATYRIIED